MQKVAKFEKVSFNQFFNSFIDTFQIEKKMMKIINLKLKNLMMIYHCLKEQLNDLQDMISKVPTGIRCKMNEDIVLMIYPRSSLGFKYRLMLDNTVGIIDSDYYNSDNEGHIFIKFTNLGEKVLEIKKGGGVAQGIFLPYYLITDDDVNDKRNGCIGSTGS